MAEHPKRNERQINFCVAAEHLQADFIKTLNHLDRREVAINRDYINDAVDEYFELIEQYKAAHHYEEGRLAGPSKIAALTIYTILNNRPFYSETGETSSTAAELMNEMFAWRLACIILEIENHTLPLSAVDQILFNMRNAPRDVEIAMTWLVTLMNMLERFYNEDFEETPEGDHVNPKYND